MPPYADSSSDIAYGDGCSKGGSNSLALASDRDPSEEHSRAADLSCLPGTHGFGRHRVGHHSLLARLSLQMPIEMGRIRLSSMSPISSHAGVRGACSYSKCMLCTEEKNDPKANWVCVVCGYIGCSRYQQGHARDHFLRSGHVYSMEIDTQRVWHYLEDT